MQNCVLRMLAFSQISSFIWQSNHHEQITRKQKSVLVSLYAQKDDIPAIRRHIVF